VLCFGFHGDNPDDRLYAQLFTMLQEMLTVLPLPTLVLLKVSAFMHHDWPWISWA